MNVRLAVKELPEKLADLGRARELLNPLEGGPGIDAKESLRILWVQIDRMSQVAGLFRHVFCRARYVVVIFLGRRRHFAEPAPDRHGVCHRIPPVAPSDPATGSL